MVSRFELSWSSLLVGITFMSVLGDFQVLFYLSHLLFHFFQCCEVVTLTVQPALTRTFYNHGPKSQSSSNSSREFSPPTTISSTISPLLLEKSAFALSRTLCALPVQFKPPSSDPRWSMVNDSILSGISLSGNRHMKGRDSLTFQNPECRCAIPRVVLHAVSVGPVATRDFAIPSSCLRL
jgi:hypothetical protein